jgi:hypothetical protein
MWLDNLLINAPEDSLVLLYRKNTAADWTLYPYYTRNFLGSNTDKRGQITIDSLQLGEYVFAMRDNTVGIIENEKIETNSLFIFPNPAKDELKIEYKKTTLAMSDVLLYEIMNVNGKVVANGKLNSTQTINSIDISKLTNGIYVLSIQKNNTFLEKKKFIIAR